MAHLLTHCLHELLAEAKEPARAVLPLAAYLVLFTEFAQWQAGLNEGSVFKIEMCAGIPAVVLGLALFKRGLRIGLMPLGEQLGEKLPTRMGPLGVCVVSFILAIGLTFAEPAIGALQMAAVLLDRDRAKLLATLFGRAWCTLLLVLVIGVGVGIAAVTGSLRLMNNWSIKRMIIWALVPCLLGSVFCTFFSEDTATIVGLAWDSGAVTTGPVTVPVVISLGIGLANATLRKQHSAQGTEMNGASPDMHEGHAHLEGTQLGGQSGDGALLQEEDAGTGDELKGFGIVTFASLWPVLGVMTLGLGVAASGAAAPAQVEAELSAPDAHLAGPPEFRMATQSIGPLVIGLLVLQRCVIAEKIQNVWEFSCGILCVFLGLAIFNIGLNFGLLPLGNTAGQRMASSYAALVQQGRPVFGVALVLCFAFVGTFAAQVAEPSLNILGETVEKLTNGAFRRLLLVYVVAFGVAVGTCTGVVKVLWDISIWKIILPMYMLAVGLTAVSAEGITCVAWDAGGVTTGSVTVPLILAMGLGLGRKRDPPVADGFGLLGCASVFPIVTVLLAGLVMDRRSRRNFIRRPPVLGDVVALG